MSDKPAGPGIPAIATAVEAFLNDAGTGAGRTRITYRTALNAFQQYLHTQELDPESENVQSLTVDQVLSWPTWLLDERGVSRRTLQTYLAGLARFIEFLQVQGWLELSSRESLRLHNGLRITRRNQAPPRLLPHPPTEDQVDALVQAARSAEVDRDNQRAELARLRNIAIIETLRASGLRVSELVSLRRRDLRAEDRSAWVVGKGQHERQVFFDETAWHAIQTYLRARQPLDGASQQPLASLPVFVRHDRRVGQTIRPMSTEAVQCVIHELAERARLEDRGITPHSLRHYFATRLYQATSDLAVTQSALGHASPVTTRVYAKLSDHAVRDAHRTAFARHHGILEINGGESTTQDTADTNEAGEAD